LLQSVANQYEVGRDADARDCARHRRLLYLVDLFK